MRPTPSAADQRRGTNGWLLDPFERAALLVTYRPAYPDAVAHHVTLKSGQHLPIAVPEHVTALLVGRVDDGRGLEALIVEIDGTTDRPDGGTYHITWSLDRAAAREARESNAVIRQLGWTPFATPVRVSLMPAYWERYSDAQS